MPLFHHFPLAFPHGVLWKFYLVSAVANEPQGRRFCPNMAPSVEGQAGAVATETTKARDPKGRANSGPGIKGSPIAHLITPLQRPHLTRLFPQGLHSPSKSTSSFGGSASVARGRFSVSSSAMMASKKAMASATSALNCEDFFGVAFCSKQRGRKRVF